MSDIGYDRMLRDEQVETLKDAGWKIMRDLDDIWFVSHKYRGFIIKLGESDDMNKMVQAALNVIVEASRASKL